MFPGLAGLRKAPSATCFALGTRADLELFHAFAAPSFKDLSSLGTLEPGLAGYTSLLSATPLAQEDGGSNYN